MKLTLKQLRGLIKEAGEEMDQARRKGGGRASLGFAIPEDSPDYGAASQKGQYYAEWDEETAMFCVFNSESPKCVATFADQSEADEYARKKNGQ